MEIYLIRHPKPVHCEGLCYGRSELTVDADVLAAAVASVRSLIPVGVLRRAAMFTSPATRCLGLARELAAPREPCMAEELRERHFGAWEGLPWEAVPRAQIDAWAADVWSYRAGGGESTAMLAARWHRWCTRVAAQIGARGLPAVAVTHAGLIRMALAGGRDVGARLLAATPFASVHRLDIDALEAATP
jgi:alpha-ribazole phosphatase